MKDVGNKNNIKGEKIMSKFELLYRIPDKMECTNMGGISIDSNGTLYCIKSKQDKSKQCLYVINKTDKIEQGFVKPSYTHMYERLGHANSLTLSGGFLYVGTDKNYIVKLSTTKLKGTTHEAGTKIGINSGDAVISSIAAVGNNQFIVHFSGHNDGHARQRVYFSSDIADTVEYNAKKMKTFTYPDTLKIEADNTEAQDMFYKDGYLYFILAEKDAKTKRFIKSHILKYRYSDCTYMGQDTFSNSSTTKFEIESMHIVGKTLFFSANESSRTSQNRDAIYIVKNWKLA